MSVNVSKDQILLPPCGQHPNPHRIALINSVSLLFNCRFKKRLNGPIALDTPTDFGLLSQNADRRPFPVATL